MLSQDQRTGANCLQLRGRLPDPDWMRVSDVIDVGLSATAEAVCQAERADGLVRTFDDAIAAWRAAFERAR